MRDAHLLEFLIAIINFATRYFIILWFLSIIIKKFFKQYKIIIKFK